MNTEQMREKLKRVFELIGRYGVQCSETKELAPSMELVDAVGELAALSAQPEQKQDGKPEACPICESTGQKTRYRECVDCGVVYALSEDIKANVADKRRLDAADQKEQPLASAQTMTDEQHQKIEQALSLIRVLFRIAFILQPSNNAILAAKSECLKYEIKDTGDAHDWIDAFRTLLSSNVQPSAVEDIDMRGFSLYLSREEWGAVFDGLMLERENSVNRKKANTESTSDLPSELCIAILQKINGASINTHKHEASAPSVNAEVHIEDLPPLPEDGTAWIYPRGYGYGVSFIKRQEPDNWNADDFDPWYCSPLFSEDQMREYALAAIRSLIDQPVRGK